MIARSLIAVALLLISGLTGCVYTIESGPSRSTSSDPSHAPRALKIGVSSAGIYRLKLEALESAGLTPGDGGLDRATLYHKGQVVPVWTDAPGQSLIFYGAAPANRYSSLSIYILRWEAEPGREMVMEELPAGVAQDSSATSTVTFEENKIYLPRAVEWAPDPWYGARLAPGSEHVVSFDLPLMAKGQGCLTVSLFGGSASSEVAPDHRVTITVNNSALSPLEWDGESVVDHSWTLPDGILHSGKNELVLSAPGDTGNPADISYLDWIKVTYPAELDRAGDAGIFAVDPGMLVVDPDTLVLDVSVEARPVRLQMPPEGGLLTSESLIAIVPPGSGREPDLIAPLSASHWSDESYTADYLVVAPVALSQELAPLLAARQAQGLATILVPIEEIGDEFGDGLMTPGALQQFFAHVLETWQEPLPRYVLLVAEATYDFRNHLGLNALYLVPSMMVQTAFGGETLSDPQLVDVDQDGQPELAIGRWPVADGNQVAVLVERTLRYENSTDAAAQALFVADTSESTFPAMSDRLIDVAGLGSQVFRLYGVTSDETIQHWNRGAWLINYVGHGSLDLWGKAELLSIKSLDDLRPVDRPPIVTQFTCLTGFFGHPQRTSLAEAMLHAENGPVATIAATSLTLAADQEDFAAAFLSELSDPSVIRIGDALLQAQQSVQVDTEGGRQVIATFHLLGDPALVIGRPN